MGYWIIGFDLNAKKNISELPKELKKVLIFGSEGKGIRPLILKNCDYKTKISLPALIVCNALILVRSKLINMENFCC